MTESKPDAGKAFFDRGDQVADTGNWDFAIEMFVEGLRREPDNLDRGHKRLREVAMIRKARGGKGPGMKDKFSHRMGKDPVENLANASYLLAKDPGNTMFMEQVLKAASDASLRDVVAWMGEILLEVQRQSKKPNARSCQMLMDIFEKAGEFRMAIQACELAMKTNPDSGPLEQRLGDLSAKYSIAQGKYEQESQEPGSFVQNVRNMEKQQELMQSDAMRKDAGFLEQQVDRTRKEYLENPDVAGKINAYVDALLKFEDPAHENEAIDVLQKAYDETGTYAFRMRLGDVKIRQGTRRIRELREKGDINALKNAAREQLDLEVQEYSERAKNYPTDLGLKFELGRRYFAVGNYDDAIGALQQAQRDPRRHIAAVNYLGQAFMKKEWWQEAIDTFAKVLDEEISEERTKEIRYYLGDCYEQMGRLNEAQEQFSTVAQVDYNFKDVRDRLEKVRQQIKQQQTG